MASDRIEQHGALAHQQIPGPMKNENTLSLRAFDRHEPHGRPGHRFADRLGIRHVVLLAFDIGLHIGGRHQLYFVSKCRDLARPVVRGRASLHADKARLQLPERVEYGAPAQLFAEDDFARFIDAVKLENRLGNIDPDCGNGHGGRLLFLLVR